MPLDGILLKIIRNDEHVWDTIEILDVSFTDLVTPEKCSLNTVKFRKSNIIINVQINIF